ncbi:unnamed protein product [Prorocentrum cordatum]|uniref:Uncharacterized protein n=1 Tax=Prorocentrum cordatum TaxID=2364126 RepID=A0ABN9Y1F2_9DINO|nr:unnamed protein product [Polarella glacialis]
MPEDGEKAASGNHARADTPAGRCGQGTCRKDRDQRGREARRCVEKGNGEEGEVTSKEAVGGARPARPARWAQLAAAPEGAQALAAGQQRSGSRRGRISRRRLEEGTRGTTRALQD